MGKLLGQEFNQHISDNPLTEAVDKPRVDVMIGLPSWQGGIDPETQMCLDQLCSFNIRNGNLVLLKKCSGSMIADNRNNIIRDAIKQDAKYVLFIDTDMVFPHNAIQWMEQHNKPVVSAVAFAKQIPFVPNMYKRVEVGGWKPMLDWKKDELIQVDCIGGAFILVKTSVFKKMNGPWFASPSILEHVCHEEVDKIVNSKKKPDEIIADIKRIYKRFEHIGNDGGGVLGEDYYFSEKCRRANVPIYVDTSLRIGHVGRYMYSYNDFSDQARRGAFDKVSKDIGIIHKDG